MNRPTYLFDPFLLFAFLFILCSFFLSDPVSLYGEDRNGKKEGEILPQASDEVEEDWSKGPLYGNSLFIIYYNYFTFPFFSAKAPQKYDLEWGISTYLTNDVLYFVSEDSSGKQTLSTERDYESIVLESDVGYSFADGWMIGGMFRFLCYYGGFMDSVIESFHQFFGFENAGREYIEYGQVYIDTGNDNDVNLFLDNATFFFGDIDLWIKYTFFESNILSLATSGGIKIPTGAFSGLSVASSGYPDLAVAVLGDLHLGRLFSLYLLAGATLPLDAFATEGAHPYPFFQGNLSVEFHPVACFSLLGQFALKSPVVSGGISDSETGEPLNNLPQTDLLFGVVFEYNDMKWQFYFEEDPFTYQGNDITFNIRFSQKINLKK